MSEDKWKTFWLSPTVLADNGITQGGGAMNKVTRKSKPDSSGLKLALTGNCGRRLPIRSTRCASRSPSVCQMSLADRAPPWAGVGGQSCQLVDEITQFRDMTSSYTIYPSCLRFANDTVVADDSTPR